MLEFGVIMFAVSAAGFTAAAVLEFVRARHRIKGALHATGIVVGLNPGTTDGGAPLPVVLFNDEDGRSVQFEDRIGLFGINHGEHVSVIYGKSLRPRIATRERLYFGVTT